ncbi:reverse transcriptase domain-containing protein [Tanacetum coccineum]
MIPIREFLQLGKLPDDPQKARKLRVKVLFYKLIDGTLYRRLYLSPWLRCVGAAQAKDIIQEVHQGSCRMHSGSQSVVSKIIRTTTNSTRRRKFPSSGHRLLHKMGQSKAANINDREAHGKVEVTNREVVKGMERRLGKTYQGWVDELPQVLWANRTTLKSSNEETPFSLVYGSEAVIPIEISVETRRIQDFNPKKNKKRCREYLDILEERREIALIKEAHYKQKLERYYNKRVRSSTFKPGTYVLRLNSASKAEFQGKMGPTWEGPYVVKKAYEDGAYKLETLSSSPIDRTWNVSNLHKFYV